MDEEQDKYLEEAVAVVKQESYLMQQALDGTNLKLALKHASNMIGELRTSLLSPKTYYELYMQVFDQLSRLEAYFMEEHRRGRKMVDLYEKVQHASSILPRLYLLITVGSVYIQTKEIPANEILKDLIEMVKGVQHPIRGLFLRYYLNKLCKDKLPDIGSEYSLTDGDVSDSVDFLLTNLSEMNRLWIRLQHTGNSTDINKREKERNDLRVTVGENIVRLSSLQGVNQELYQNIVLPKILEVVTSSKDAISQQYLLDCIIQAFPDAYHLHTLEPLLQTCTELQPNVDVKSIFVNLLTRLAEFVGESEMDAVNQVDIFGLIKTYIDKLIAEKSSGSEIKKFLLLEVAFLKFTLKCYPKITDNVNSILDSSVNLITKNVPDRNLDGESIKSIVKLLSIPLETLSLSILSMNHYPNLLEYLEFYSRKQVSFKIVQAAVASKKSLDSFDTVKQLLEFTTPLWAQNKETTETDAYEFEDEQQNMAKLVHLVRANDLNIHYEILELFKEKFTSGGETRIKFTFPALFFAYIKLMRIADSKQETDLIDTILKTLAHLISKIFDYSPDSALKFHLECAQAINLLRSKTEFESYAFEFANQAFNVYQEELAESNIKYLSISSITACLINMSCFEEDNKDSLVVKSTKLAARQLKKTDQCSGVINCTHLFYNDNSKDDRLVLECLKKARKIADICALNPKNIYLFGLLLNKYIYYYNLQVDTIDSSDINSIILDISDHLNDVESGQDYKVDTSETQKYLKNTAKYMRARQAEGKFKGINLDKLNF